MLSIVLLVPVLPKRREAVVHLEELRLKPCREGLVDRVRTK